MARRVHTSDDFGGVQEWWSSIPPVTRCLGALWGVSAILGQFKILPLHYLYLDFYSIFRRFQIWRLVTHVGFLGGFSPHFAIRMLWLFIYSPVIERTMTEYSPGDYAFFILFSILSFTLFGLFNPFVMIAFSAGPLTFAIMYLWSREFSSQEVSLFGLVKLKAFYLPWAMMVVGMVFGASSADLLQDLTGIAVGHLFYFLKTIYPAQTGQQLLKCPLWLIRFMGKYYKKAQPVQQPGERPPEAAAGSGFQAFGGTARRLQD